MSNNKNNIFKTFLFEKSLCFVRKHIWKNSVYFATFVLQFFCLTGYWKCSNKTPATIQVCIGLENAILRPKILGYRLTILMEVLIEMNYVFFIIYFREVPST